LDDPNLQDNKQDKKLHIRQELPDNIQKAVFTHSFCKKVEHKPFTYDCRVFDQTFFEKVCGQAFSQKGCDHAVSRVLIKLFSKVCEQAFFEKVCGQAFFKKVGFRV